MRIPNPRLAATRSGMTTPARQEFTGELAKLEQATLEGLDMVVAQIDRAIEALEHQDIELAQIVIADDDRIDGRYLEIHQSVLTLLALQAPVAGDLRLVAAILHTVKHMERMADQCVNIAKMIPLVAQCRQAFAVRDVGLAEDLVRQDRSINVLNKEIFRMAVEIGDDVDTREWAMSMTMVARAFERIGDNAVDVGEQVAFIESGLFREFGDIARTAPPAE
jgi:phosphate transport system protein